MRPSGRWKIVGPKQAFIIQGDDRVGALVEYFGKLAAAKVNATATDALTVGVGQFSAILWVKARDVKRAATALGVGLSERGRQRLTVRTSAGGLRPFVTTEAG